jgi:Haem-binding domain
MIKKILLILLVVLIVLQLFRPKLTNTATVASAGNINNSFAVPADIDQVLKTSCYDCHSNKTTYPWYASVQPVGWWLQDHVNEGKKELNFDEFGTYSLRRQYKKLEEIGEQVDEGEMPLSSYTIIHSNAKLTPEQKRQVMGWSEQLLNEMKAKYPVDSLIRKK